MGPPPGMMQDERPLMGPPPGDMRWQPTYREDGQSATVFNEFCINGGRVVLKDVQMSLPNGELMRVRRDKRLKKSGEGHLVLSTDSVFTYRGNVYADKQSTASVTVGAGVTWEGALNPNKRSRRVTAVVEGTWNLTRDSYIDKLVISKHAMVNTNGHKLKYKTLENEGTLH